MDVLEDGRRDRVGAGESATESEGLCEKGGSGERYGRGRSCSGERTGVPRRERCQEASFRGGVGGERGRGALGL